MVFASERQATVFQKNHLAKVVRDYFGALGLAQSSD